MKIFIITELRIQEQKHKQKLTSYREKFPREIKKRGNKTICELHAFKSQGICKPDLGISKMFTMLFWKAFFIKLLNIMQTS